MDLLPAYGRDYLNKEAVIKDWESNKDFICQTSGSYINKEDAQIQCIPYVRISFNRNRKTVTIYI